MFGYRRTNNSGVAPTIKQVAANTAVTYAVGDALVLTSGKLAKAGATVKPEYISAEKASGKDVLSVYQVESNQEYETTLSTAGELVVGTKVTLSSTADSVTATTTSGVAEVVSVAGSTSGSAVVVRF
jgi:hypothetical protein